LRRYVFALAVAIFRLDKKYCQFVSYDSLSDFKIYKRDELQSEVQKFAENNLSCRKVCRSNEKSK
jgi:hypothetical protein